jgi:hypothetical protein
VDEPDRSLKVATRVRIPLGLQIQASKASKVKTSSEALNRHGNSGQEPVVHRSATCRLAPSRSGGAASAGAIGFDLRMSASPFDSAGCLKHSCGPRSRRRGGRVRFAVRSRSVTGRARWIGRRGRTPADRRNRRLVAGGEPATKLRGAPALPAEGVGVAQVHRDPCPPVPGNAHGLHGPLECSEVRRLRQHTQP